MATALLVLVVVLVIAGLVFGVVSLLSGDDPGLVPVEPDGRARPLPNDRSLHEEDLAEVRFDVALRGYRMAQVDRVLRRTAYDLGFKDEMIAVLEAEVTALRDGRREDADLLRKARESAASPEPAPKAGTRANEPLPEATDEVSDVAPEQDSSDGADPHQSGTDDARTQATTVVEPEQREGSLRRRKAGSETTPAATSPVALAAGPEPDLDEPAPALEVADRPAHA